MGLLRHIYHWNQRNKKITVLYDGQNHYAIIEENAPPNLPLGVVNLTQIMDQAIENALAVMKIKSKENLALKAE